MIAICQMSHTGLTGDTELGDASWSLTLQAMLLAEPGYQALDANSFLALVLLVFTELKLYIACVGRKSQPDQYVPLLHQRHKNRSRYHLPGFSMQRKREKERERKVMEERQVLSLRMWSDNFSPMPCTAGRSLPGWGPVERFSPQIFCNKVRYGNCAEVGASRVIEIPSPSTWGSTEPSARLLPGNSEGTWIQGQSNISAPLERMSGSSCEHQELLSHETILVNCSWHPPLKLL